MNARLKQRLTQVLSALPIQCNRNGNDCTGKVGNLLFVRGTGMVNQITDVVGNYPNRRHHSPIDIHMLLAQQFFRAANCIAQNTYTRLF